MILGKLSACAAAGALTLALFAVPAALADPAKAPAPAYKAPINFYGQPDLGGTWTNATLTNLIRPSEYGDRLVMTPQEVAKIEGDDAKAVAEGNKPTDPKLKVTDLPYECGRGFSGVGCGYNAAWVDPGTTVMRVNGEPRTSFITNPANGKLPAFKAGFRPSGFFFGGGEGRVIPPALLAQFAKRADNPETMSLGERCIMSFGLSAGPVMLPLLYNNNYEIVQSKDTVAIEVEMVHDVRVIRIGGEHRTDGVRPWLGDSIGHYEGKTLVVETTNFPKAQAFIGAWQNLKVTERFTRVAPDRILYQFTIEDPTVWDQPWGGEYEFSKSKGIIYEYACHEGNYALADMLAGARADEAAAAAKTAQAAPGPAAAPATTSKQ
ncbi:MAG: hypothetical protein ACHP7N_06510 [Caulobacterales bacterium]